MLSLKHILSLLFWMGTGVRHNVLYITFYYLSAVFTLAISYQHQFTSSNQMQQTVRGSGYWAADAGKHQRTRSYRSRSFTTPKRETKPTETGDERREKHDVTSSRTRRRRHTKPVVCAGKNRNPKIPSMSKKNPKIRNR